MSGAQAWSSTSQVSSIDAKSERVSACIDASPKSSRLSLPKTCRLPSHTASSTSSRQWGRLEAASSGQLGCLAPKQTPSAGSR